MIPALVVAVAMSFIAVPVFGHIAGQQLALHRIRRLRRRINVRRRERLFAAACRAEVRRIRVHHVGKN